MTKVLMTVLGCTAVYIFQKSSDVISNDSSVEDMVWASSQYAAEFNGSEL